MKIAYVEYTRKKAVWLPEILRPSEREAYASFLKSVEFRSFVEERAYKGGIVEGIIDVEGQVYTPNDGQVLKAIQNDLVSQLESEIKHAEVALEEQVRHLEAHHRESSAAAESERERRRQEFEEWMQHHEEYAARDVVSLEDEKARLESQHKMLVSTLQVIKAAHQSTVVPNGSGSAKPGGSPLRVFISYSTEDDEHVKHLVEALDAGGFDVRQDKRSFGAGDSIYESIDKHILDCDAVILVATKNSLASTFVAYEIGKARARTVKFVTVTTDGKVSDLAETVSIVELINERINKLEATSEKYSKEGISRTFVFKEIVALEKLRENIPNLHNELRNILSVDIREIARIKATLRGVAPGSADAGG